MVRTGGAEYSASLMVSCSNRSVRSLLYIHLEVCDLKSSSHQYGMQCRNCTTAAEALLRVFIPSTTSVTTHSRSSRQLRAFQPHLLRFYNYYASPIPDNGSRPAFRRLHNEEESQMTQNLEPKVRRPQFGPKTGTPRRLRDEEIGGRMKYVRVVYSDGKIQEPQPLNDVLRSFDRTNNFLVQVSAPEEGTEEEYPVCRVLAKRDVYAHEQARTKKAGGGGGMVTKQIEISWITDQNDFRHKMDRLEEFLTDGKRVEIVLIQRRKGKKRVASEPEMEGMLKAIRERVAGIVGAKESREVERKPGGIMTLTFEGTVKKVEKKEEKEEGLTTKDQEKLEKAEARRAKKAEEARLATTMQADERFSGRRTMIGVRRSAR